MAAFKLSFSDYKHLKSNLVKMNQKELSRWIDSVYSDGYKDGYEACKNEPGQTIDLELLKIAIRATEGIGEKKMEKIIENIEKLCF